MNPNRKPDERSNRIKDPDQWVTGDEEMSGAQASHLHSSGGADARLLHGSGSLLGRQNIGIGAERQEAERFAGKGVRDREVVRSQASYIAFRQRVRELIEGREALIAVIPALLEAHETLRTQYNVPHKRLLDLVRDDPLCRRLMTAPGVEPVIALTFQATVDVPTRFPQSRLGGAHFGLTPKRYASGAPIYITDRPC